MNLDQFSVDKQTERDLNELVGLLSLINRALTLYNQRKPDFARSVVAPLHAEIQAEVNRIMQGV
jgi:hypothetical protein